jgi:DNA-binding LacI/PurR family transcriptional regulator
MSGKSQPLRQTEVAKRAGVSPATVSKVINGGTGISPALRSRVLQTMQEMGYLPDEAQRRLGSIPRRICLVTYFQFLSLDTSYFHAEVIRSITSECAHFGISVESVLLDRDGPRDIAGYRQQLKERGDVDGVLTVGIDSLELLAPLRGSSKAVIIVNGNDPLGMFDSVSPAARLGSYLAAQHLLACGHREIVHVTHLNRPFIQQRLDGFREALEQAGIPFDASRHLINIDSQIFSAQRASKVIGTMVRQGSLKATALHCVSDYTAFGVIQGLQRAGRRVPQDYSVVSFDDLPFAPLCTPPLTSVGIDRAHLGRMAVKQLINRHQHPEEPAQRLETGPRLSIRESVQTLHGRAPENA